MDNDNGMLNGDDHLEIDAANREMIDISVIGKYLNVDILVKIRNNDFNNGSDRLYEVLLSFHDDHGNESYIHLIRDNRGRFTIYDGRYLDR